MNHACKARMIDAPILKKENTSQPYHPPPSPLPPCVRQVFFLLLIRRIRMPLHTHTPSIQRIQESNGVRASCLFLSRWLHPLFIYHLSRPIRKNKTINLIPECGKKD